jgi:3-oxoadipate enol-lactonase
VALPRDAVLRAAVAVAIDPPDVLGRIGTLTTPTLVLCGREDRGYPPALSERIVRAIPGARLEWIEEAGHLCPLERPEAVNRVLLPFVAERMA